MLPRMLPFGFLRQKLGGSHALVLLAGLLGLPLCGVLFRLRVSCTQAEQPGE